MTELRSTARLMVAGLAVLATAAGCERAAQEGAADGVNEVIQAVIEATIIQAVDDED